MANHYRPAIDKPYQDLTDIQEQRGAEYLTALVADAQLVLNACGIPQGPTLEKLTHWRDLTECVCYNETPIGGCLRCDLDALIYQAQNTPDPVPPTPPQYNDPKGAAGAKKVPLGLIPAVAMTHTAWVHNLGKSKYGEANWRATGVCASTYVNAILRHLNAWREGEDNDPESGITHLTHVACCCNILMDAAHCGTLQDDRNKTPQNKS